LALLPDLALDQGPTAVCSTHSRTFARISIHSPDDQNLPEKLTLYDSVLPKPNFSQ